MPLRRTSCRGISGRGTSQPAGIAGCRRAVLRRPRNGLFGAGTGLRLYGLFLSGLVADLTPIYDEQSLFQPFHIADGRCENPPQNPSLAGAQLSFVRIPPLGCRDPRTLHLAQALSRQGVPAPDREIVRGIVAIVRRKRKYYCLAVTRGNRCTLVVRPPRETPSAWVPSFLKRLSRPAAL